MLFSPSIKISHHLNASNGLCTKFIYSHFSLRLAYIIVRVTWMILKMTTRDTDFHSHRVKLIQSIRSHVAHNHASKWIFCIIYEYRHNLSRR